MHVGKQLRRLRKEFSYTLIMLDDKLHYGTGNFSNYENGKSNPTDATLLKILTKGYNYTKEQSQEIIRLWRKEEFDSNYDKTKGTQKKISQESEAYNKIDKKNFEYFLALLLEGQGLSKKEVSDIKAQVEFCKHKKKK